MVSRAHEEEQSALHPSDHGCRLRMLRRAVEMGMRDPDWLDQWYPPPEPRQTVGSSGNRGSGVPGHGKVKSGNIAQRTGNGETSHYLNLPGSKLFVDSGIHKPYRPYSSRVNCQANNKFQIEEHVRDAQNKCEPGSKSGKETDSRKFFTSNKASHHHDNSFERMLETPQDLSLSSPRNIEGVLASPFYDKDFWVPRRPLAPNRVYHFHVIYNHGHGALGRSPDNELALRVASSLVEKLELRGYVNGYYHDRDRRSNNRLSAELERVIAGSSLTILLLTPGFLKDSLDRYLQISAFRELLAQQPPHTGQLVVLGVGVTQASLPHALGRHDVLFFREDDWEADHPAWSRLDDVLLHRFDRTDKRKETRNCDVDGLQAEMAQGCLISEYVRNHATDFEIDDQPRECSKPWALTSYGQVEIFFDSEETERNRENFVLDSALKYAPDDHDFIPKNSSGITHDTKEIVNQTGSEHLSHTPLVSSQEMELCEWMDANGTAATETKPTSSASKHYFRLTEHLLRADDLHDMGLEHAAWDPGGEENDTEQTLTHEKAARRCHISISPRHKAIEVDAGEVEESHGTQSEVTSLDGTLDTIGLMEMRERYEFGSQSSLCADDWSLNDSLEGVELGTLRDDREFADLGTVSLWSGASSINTLDTTDLKELLERYGVDAYEIHDVYTNAFDNKHLDELPAQNDFRGRNLVTPVSDVSMNTLDTSDLVQNDDHYGYGGLSRAVYGSSYHDQSSFDDLDEEALWYSWQREDECGAVKGGVLFVQENSRHCAENLSLMINNENLEDSLDTCGTSIPFLLKGDQILSSLPPEDTLYKAQVIGIDRELSVWEQNGGLCVERGYQREQTEISPITEPSAILYTESKMELFAFNDPSDTLTVEELWTKWVDSPCEETNVKNMDTSISSEAKCSRISEKEANSELYPQAHEASNTDQTTATDTLELGDGQSHHLQFEQGLSVKGRKRDAYTVDMKAQLDTRISSKESQRSAYSSTLCADTEIKFEENSISRAKSDASVVDLTNQRHQNDHRNIEIGITVIETQAAESAYTEITSEMCHAPDRGPTTCDSSRCLEALDQAIKDAIGSAVCGTPRNQEVIGSVNGYEKGLDVDHDSGRIELERGDTCEQKQEIGTVDENLSLQHGQDGVYDDTPCLKETAASAATETLCHGEQIVPSEVRKPAENSRKAIPKTVKVEESSEEPLACVASDDNEESNGTTKDLSYLYECLVDGLNTLIKGSALSNGDVENTKSVCNKPGSVGNQSNKVKVISESASQDIRKGTRNSGTKKIQESTKPPDEAVGLQSTVRENETLNTGTMGLFSLDGEEDAFKSATKASATDLRDIVKRNCSKQTELVASNQTTEPMLERGEMAVGTSLQSGIITSIKAISENECTVMNEFLGSCLNQDDTDRHAVEDNNEVGLLGVNIVALNLAHGILADMVAKKNTPKEVEELPKLTCKDYSGTMDTPGSTNEGANKTPTSPVADEGVVSATEAAEDVTMVVSSCSVIHQNETPEVGKNENNDGTLTESGEKLTAGKVVNNKTTCEVFYNFTEEKTDSIVDECKAGGSMIDDDDDDIEVKVAKEDHSTGEGKAETLKSSEKLVVTKVIEAVVPAQSGDLSTGISEIGALYRGIVSVQQLAAGETEYLPTLKFTSTANKSHLDEHSVINNSTINNEDSSNIKAGESSVDRDKVILMLVTPHTVEERKAETSSSVDASNMGPGLNDANTCTPCETNTPFSSLQSEVQENSSSKATSKGDNMQISYVHDQEEMAAACVQNEEGSLEVWSRDNVKMPLASLEIPEGASQCNVLSHNNSKSPRDDNILEHERYLNVYEECDESHYTIRAKDGEDEKSVVLSDSVTLLYDISCDNQMQNIAKGIVQNVLLSSLKRLRLAQSGVFGGNADTDQQLVWKQTSEPDVCDINHLKIEESAIGCIPLNDPGNNKAQTDSQSELSPSTQTLSEQGNCKTANHRQLGIDFANESIFSEAQIVRASSPRLDYKNEDNPQCQQSNSIDTITSSIISLGFGASNDGNGRNDLKYVDTVQYSEKQVRDGIEVEDGEYGICRGASNTNSMGQNGNLKNASNATQRRHSHDAMSVSPRGLPYNEGDSGFFDPCDSVGTREESEPAVDWAGVSTHDAANRDLQVTSSIQAAMRAADIRLNIVKEEDSPRDNLESREGGATASWHTETGGVHQHSFSTALVPILEKYKQVVTTGCTDTYSQLLRATEETTHVSAQTGPEKGVNSSTLEESFSFRVPTTMKVSSTEEDLTTTSEHTGFREVRLPARDCAHPNLPGLGLTSRGSTMGDDLSSHDTASDGEDSASVGRLSLRGFLDESFSSTRSTPQLTPRSMSNFHRLRSMHRQAHGLSVEGLLDGPPVPQLQATGGEDAQELPTTDESTAVGTTEGGEKAAQAEGQKAASGWFLQVYKGVCHVIAKPDMPYMG